MTTVKYIALPLALTLFALLATTQAQTARLSTVNVTSDGERIHVAAQGDVYDWRVDIADESGDVVFQSGQMTGQTLDWNMRDVQGERVAAGTYLVTVTFRAASGKLRKRVEQVTVSETDKSGTQAITAPAPNAVQATITGSGTTNRIAKFTGASTIGDSGITASGGNIGIGTTAPTTTLTVVGALSNFAALSSANDATNGIGIKGSSTDAGGVGVKGIHAATTGVTPGVKGETNSTDSNAVAVLGVVNSTTAGDWSAAVKGVNKDTSLLGCGVCGTPIGVWGEQAKNGYGVYGFAPHGVGVYGNSNDGTGVYAQASSGTGVSGNSGSGDGVVGSSTDGYAGHFLGKAKVEGSLEVTNGLTVTGGCTGCTMPSDQNLKTNFSLINPRLVLNRLTTLPIKAWNYKSDEPTVRHLGPMAQDFRAAFNLGVDDKHIDMIDANGVTMAAIQGLYQMSLEQNKNLKREVAELRARLDQLERTMKKPRTTRKNNR